MDFKVTRRKEMGFQDAIAVAFTALVVWALVVGDTMAAGTFVAISIFLQVTNIKRVKRVEPAVYDQD